MAISVVRPSVTKPRFTPRPRAPIVRYRCPDCGKRRVLFRQKSHGEDVYECRACDFWVFASPDASDADGQARLRRIADATGGEIG